jgi:hypothetical protein
MTSTTNSKMLKVLRPYEEEFVVDFAGRPLDVLFDRHRADVQHRGYADWLRLILAGSVFASIPEFATEKSKYILHQDQTLSNSTWFQMQNFPFLWYEGGRYHVFANRTLWYYFDLPYDLTCRIKKLSNINRRTYLPEEWLTSSNAKDKEAFVDFISKECNVVNENKEYDDHAYLGTDLDAIRERIHEEVFGALEAEEE